VVTKNRKRGSSLRVSISYEFIIITINTYYACK
jgi:hypothetical protein